MDRRFSRFNLFLCALLTCTLATWALGLIDLKYQQETDIAFVNGFPGDPELWQPAGDWSNIEIDAERITVFRQTEDRSYAKRRYELPDYPARSAHTLRVSGVVETNEVVDNPSDEEGASLMVWLEDTKGEIVNYLTVFSMRGDRDRYQGERIINLPDDIKAFTLVMNSRDSANSFSLVDGSADIVSVTLNYMASVAMLLMAWFVIAALIALWFLRHAPMKTTLLAGALIAGIFVGVMMPETPTVPIIDPVFQAVAAKLNLTGIDSGTFIYKTGHFLFFFFTSLVLMLKSDILPANKWQIASVMILLAVATEGMQLHLANRTTQLFDIGVDSAGVLLALAVSKFILSRRFKSADDNPEAVKSP